MESKASEVARAWWPIVAVAAGALIAWGSLSSQVSTLAENNKTVILKLDRIAEGMATKTATAIAANDNIGDLRARLNRLEARR